MAINAGTIVADAKMDMRGFMRDLSVMKKSGTKAADRIGKKYKALGGRMQSIGRSMTMSLTAPLAAMGAASVKAFSTFDSEMTKSTAIMGNVSKKMRKTMEQAAMSVSEDLNMASSKAAESFFFLASAGLDAEQSVAALPQVAEFAKAGMFDMATATDLATDAQSALGLTVDNAAQNMQNLTRVTDTLVKANTLANASVQQFSEALTNRAAAALRAANKEVEEGVAVLSAFADQGLKGQRAGEQLARILRILSQQAAKNKELFKDLGIIDASGNLASMSDIIKILTQEMAGLSDTAKSAKLEQLGFTARVQASIKPLLGTSQAIKEYKSQLEDAGGITKEVADKQMKSFSQQLGVTWQMIRNAGIEIGRMLAPMLGKLNKILQAGIKAWKSLSDTAKGVTLTISGLAAAIGPITLAMGTMVSLLPTIMTGFAALTSPITGVIAAVGGLAAAFIYLSDNWEAVKERLSSVAWWKNALIEMMQLAMEFNPMQIFIKPYEELLSMLGMELPNPFDTTAKALEKLKKDTEDYEHQFGSFTDAVVNGINRITGLNLGGASGIGSQMEIPQNTLDTFRFATRLLNENLFPAMQRNTQSVKRYASAWRFATQTLNENWAPTAKKTSKFLPVLNDITDRFVNSFGQGMANVVVQGKKVVDVLKNIGKLLLSSAIQKGISILLTGGLAGGGFFGKGGGLFGNIFHGGGIVGGIGDQPIIAKGGEGVFTRGQMKALGLMARSSSGGGMSAKEMEKAFDRALGRRLQKLGPKEIYGMSKDGQRYY